MQEGCSGDPARRAGNEYLPNAGGDKHVDVPRIRVKRIVASCPHCFHTLGKEYGDFGGDDLEVFHHSEIIAKLQKEGKLPEAEKNGRSITFHDPCYLGRIEISWMPQDRSLEGSTKKPKDMAKTHSAVVREGPKCGWRKMLIRE